MAKENETKGIEAKSEDVATDPEVVAPAKAKAKVKAPEPVKQASLAECNRMATQRLENVKKKG